MKNMWQGFTWLSSLCEHMYLHLDTTAFKCGKCGYHYKCKAELKRHSAVHEWKVYCCKLCKFHTRIEKNMIDHQCTRHGEAKYSCDVCGKMFKYRMSCLHHVAICKG